jgi:light-regulated signal transduction histidine kinase (bacteriophytochrome)
MRIALSNLLGNAWKFTSRNASATIEVGVMRAPEGPIFFVRDDGVGFDPADADKLFTAFQRLHSAAEFEGSGVGLATVSRVIERHGGRVWAEGAPGAGATFFFTVPQGRPLG